MLFLANPGRGAVSIAVVLGVTAFVWGAVLCGLAIWVRRSAARPGAAMTGPARP